MNMITCKKCGNLASYNSHFGQYYCSVCGEYFSNNTATNADHIRSMTDEELAEWLLYEVRCRSCNAENCDEGFCLIQIEELLECPCEEHKR